MKYNPHEYQKYAINYIEEKPVAAVFLDMGLGKTSICLTAINNLLFDSFDVHKVLVIGPLRVARDTWPAEASKWNHLSNLIISVVIGTNAERIAALKKKADVYIVNRENVQWLVEDSGFPFDFDMVIVDELSSFKNHQSKRFRSLLKVRPKIKRIVGLSGTPAANSIADLWAEFRLLDCGERLGRYIGQFRAQYLMPDKQNGQVIFSYKPQPGAEQQIYNRIGDITISMKSTDYLKMPELISSEYTVYMSDEETKQYENLKEQMVLQLPDKEITAANAASLTNKLCQLANGAIYDDDKEIIPLHDHKLDALEDLIEAASGKPLLVAYWFQHDLKRIEERLRKLGVCYSRIDSSESIEAWNAGKLTVGLIHPASAGHGLNLQNSGSCIVWFGLTWSLELYQQTNARLWRQGQTASTVVVQHIVTKGTIDERILKALQKKDKTQSALIDAVKADLHIQ